jgi:hypothetical protein
LAITPAAQELKEKLKEQSIESQGKKKDFSTVL